MDETHESSTLIVVNTNSCIDELCLLFSEARMTYDGGRQWILVKATGGGPRSLLICYRSPGDLEGVEDRIKKYCS